MATIKDLEKKYPQCEAEHYIIPNLWDDNTPYFEAFIEIKIDGSIIAPTVIKSEKFLYRGQAHQWIEDKIQEIIETVWHKE